MNGRGAHWPTLEVILAPLRWCWFIRAVFAMGVHHVALDHPAILSFPQRLVEEDCLERNCGSCKNHHQEHEGQHHPIWPHEDSLQESYNTPRYRTPNRQSPYPTMKGFPLQPVGKSLGVCSKGVLKQPWILMATQPTNGDHKPWS